MRPISAAVVSPFRLCTGQLRNISQEIYLAFFEEMPIMITTSKTFRCFCKDGVATAFYFFLHKFGSAYHHRLEGLSLKMGQAAVLAWLEERGIGYELVAHKGIYTSAEGQELHLPKAERVAKNLFYGMIKTAIFFAGGTTG